MNRRQFLTTALGTLAAAVVPKAKEIEQEWSDTTHCGVCRAQYTPCVDGTKSPCKDCDLSNSLHLTDDQKRAALWYGRWKDETTQWNRAYTWLLEECDRLREEIAVLREKNADLHWEAQYWYDSRTRWKEQASMLLDRLTAERKRAEEIEEYYVQLVSRLVDKWWEESQKAKLYQQHAEDMTRKWLKVSGALQAKVMEGQEPIIVPLDEA